MKAVILAAGKGTRMRELTDALPKPMLKVQGKPILEHILAGLSGAGIRDVFIVTGYRAEVVEDHFGGGELLGMRIAYGRQAVQDGTGNPEMARRFQEGQFSGLVTVTASADVMKGGLNLFDDKFCLTRLVEKPSARQITELREQGWLKPGQPAWCNAGIYIFRPVLFEFTARLQKSPRGEYELTDALNDMVAAGHRFAGMPIPGRWVDVRDPEVLAALEKE